MFKQAMMASAVVLASAGVHAASATVTVTGTISPEACTLSLGNNGNLNYGNLSLSTVRGYQRWFGNHRSLPMKTIPMNISCPSPTRVGFSVTDNRASSKDASLPNPDIKFGLGYYGQRQIGFFEIGTGASHLQPTRSAGATDAGTVLERNGAGNWSLRSQDVSANYLALNTTIAFSTGIGATRMADITPIVNMTTDLVVAPKILDSVLENATSEIALNGSVTLDLVYP